MFASLRAVFSDPAFSSLGEITDSPPVNILVEKADSKFSSTRLEFKETESGIFIQDCGEPFTDETWRFDMISPSKNGKNILMFQTKS